jgi:hypothetical protein
MSAFFVVGIAVELALPAAAPTTFVRSKQVSIHSPSQGTAVAVAGDWTGVW